MVKYLRSPCYSVGGRKNGLVESHIYPFCIFFEVPVLMAIGVFTQNTRSDTNLEWLLIHFFDLGLFSLNLVFKITQLVCELVLLLF
jgi:hypothetical protein